MKKNLTFSKLLMLVVIAILPMSMYAQEGKKTKPVERYWYIQADGGLSINHGDLAQYTGGIWDDFDHFKSQALQNWNAHFGIGYQFGKVIGMNLKGGYGLLSGHKHGQELVFIKDGARTSYWDLGLDKTNYFEGNLNLTFNLFNMFKYNPRRVINFVPHVGIGGIYYQAGVVNQLNGVDKGEGQVVRELAPATSDRELNFTVPVGAEFTFNLAPKFDIFIDYTYLFTGTDALDQVAKIASDEAKHVINDKDMYSQLNLGLRFKFNNPCDIDKMARDSRRITYKVNPDPLVADENGKVCFDVITTIPAEYFEKQAVMNLKPYLAYNGGQIDLDPITFVGEKVKGEGDFRVNYKEGGEFTKHYCMDYVPEMENCELMGDPMFYVYDGKIYKDQDEIVKNSYYAQGYTVKLADGVINTNVNLKCEEPENVTITAVDEKTLTVSWKGSATSYDIYLSNGARPNDNTVPTAKGVTATSYTFTDLEPGNYGIYVRGYCEDVDSQSEWTGANAANKDIKAQLKRKAKNFEYTAKGNGPDWDKFEELVANSNLKDKDAILNNIRKSGNREQAIKEMINIYPQLEDEILPLISRAEVYITK